MRLAALVASILVLFAPAVSQAQQVAPPGAIRTLGTSRHLHHHRRHGVRIPRYIGRIRHPAIRLPPGTSRPGPSRSFIPAY